MSKKRNYRLFLFVLLLADMLAAGGLGILRLKEAIPDTVYIRAGQDAGLEEFLDLPLVTYPESIGASENGSYQIPCSFLGIVPLKQVEVKTVEDKELSVCGIPVGLYMETQGVLIVDTGEIMGQDGVLREPAANIAKAGDYILEVNGCPVTRKKQLISEIQESQGETMKLLVSRKGEAIPLSLDPVQTGEEEYKLGIWVRDNTQGIGTMTYIEEDGTFGALGHGISDTDTGELLDVSGGELYQAQILSIMKGAKGTPGELSGYIEYQDQKKLGKITTNTEKGIFGKISNPQQWPVIQAKVGYKQEVKEGKAEIVTDLGDGAKTYEILITDIYKERSDTNKAFEIQVTDSRLLAKTGGIVQGMSGSPVLQNGKIIGAVTHVFVRDPAKGYGIFIENMLW
nr:SpoIVB peptidase [uncultured Blautia sp.]